MKLIAEKESTYLFKDDECIYHLIVGLKMLAKFQVQKEELKIIHNMKEYTGEQNQWVTEQISSHLGRPQQ